MATDSPRPSAETGAASRHDDVERTRMSFGQHLEELRGCLIRALIGVGLGTAGTLAFAQEILLIIYRPLLIVQHANGLQPNMQLLSPQAGFAVYLKIGFLSGLILTMPWVLYQIWMFVAGGLYPKEKRFTKRLILPSLGLFASGVLFLYFIVLPIVLQFFISFNQKFKAPDLTPTRFQSWLLPTPEPVNPSRLMLKTPTDLWSMAFDRRATSAAMQSQFALDFYVSFVLVLALAFGIAFETPLVVFFLSWSGLVSVGAMARARRYVVLGTVMIAAVLTPPDVISQVLLAGPMYLLFEAGLLVARMTERKKTASV